MTSDLPASRAAVSPTAANGWIGLVAGAGRFPITFARAARLQGLKVYGLGVQGMVSEELVDSCARFATAGLARLGRAIRPVSYTPVRAHET